MPSPDPGKKMSEEAAQMAKLIGSRPSTGSNRHDRVTEIKRKKSRSFASMTASKARWRKGCTKGRTEIKRKKAEEKRIIKMVRRVERASLRAQPE